MGLQFYVYLYLRKNGTPYYVGKGSGRRVRNHNPRLEIKPPKDKTRILLLPRASEQAAFDTEKELIRNWGRKDTGTGCLRNRTDGGEGASGVKCSEDLRRRRSEITKQRYADGWKPSEETRRALSDGAKRYMATDEAKQKVREAVKSRKFSLEGRRRLSESAKRHYAALTEEQKKEFHIKGAIARNKKPRPEIESFSI